MEHKKKPRLELPESDYETESDTETDSSSDVSSHVSSLVRSSSLPSLASFSTPFTSANLSTFATPNILSLANPNVFPFTASFTTISQVPQDAGPPPFNAPATLNSNLALFAKPTVPPRPSINNVASNVQSTSSATNISSAAFSNLSPARLGESDDGEQLRASFRAACEEINRELDIIMQPLKTKQQTLKAIEDYLVVLSKRANQPFKVDLTDDSFTTNVSLKVDKNKVTVFRQHTPPNQQQQQQQQGEDSQQQSEGADSNVPGPSNRLAQNNSAGGEACWMPPVNPFTSSVTLRQHLEAASNNVRPRRMRPPPGFHPTPQYNDGQGTSAGVVRPPPGFHGLSSGNVPGPSGSSVPGYYGLLDETTNQQQLLYSMVPRQVPQSEIRQYHFLSQGYREPPPTTSSVQYGYEQAEEAHANELWQHYSNAAAISNADIPEDGAGYWDDFLQKEVYDILNTDQDSDLWRQFEEYQRVQYAPGSLRTGSTIFCSENVGPSKHGPVGHCRPRAHSHRRCRPIENIRIQCNFDQLPQLPRHVANVGCGPQDVLTLSERFKNASIANPTNNRPPRNNDCPQNRNALLGALLLKRLKERAASVFSETNATMNVPATTAAPSANTNNISASSINNNSSGQNVVNVTNNSMNSSISVEQLPCTYCTQNNRAAGCPTHVLRDAQGRTVCPILRNRPCPICNKAGDNGHSVHECPVRKQWDMDDDKTGKKTT